MRHRLPEKEDWNVDQRRKRFKLEIGAYVKNDVNDPHPIDPPGGTIATRRSNALQLFVYISRTKARGTSAFLIREIMEEKRERKKKQTNGFQISSRKWGRKGGKPATEHSDVSPFFTGVLCRMGE